MSLTCPLGANKSTSSCLSGGNLSVKEIKGVESKEQTPVFSPKRRTCTAYRTGRFSWLFSPRWTSKGARILLGVAQSERPMLQLLPATQVYPQASWSVPLRGAVWDREGDVEGGGSFSLHLCCSECGPSVPPAGVLEMVWHLNHTIFTDLNTNGYCLIVSWFISQTSSPLPPAQLLQSKPLSLNRPDYYFPSKVLICVIST